MNIRSPLIRSMLLALMLTGTAYSQDDSEPEPADPAPDSAADNEAIDEIVVRANRDGDPKTLEMQKAEMLRAQVFAMYEQVKRDEEETVWRSSLPKAYGNFGGIKWGYDADAELRMRRESGLDDVAPGEVRPATIIRVEF